jgi:hypothetical protein
MKTAPNKRGPKPINGSEKMKSRTLRTTDAEWEKCLALGGATWVRDRINEAPKPKRSK